MATDSKPTELIIKLIEAGSNVIVSSTKPSALLVDIAKAAQRNKVQATFLNCQGIPTENLMKVATAGGKYVTFEV